MLRSLSSAMALLLWAAAAFAEPNTEVLTALKRGDAILAADLLRQASAMEPCAQSGVTPLHVAAAYGYPEIVQMLLEAGVDAGERGPNGNTPLLYAAQGGHAEVVKMLLQAGSDPDAQNDVGATAAGLALGFGHRDVTGALIGAVAPADRTGSSINSWLWAAGLLAAATGTGAALLKHHVGAGAPHSRHRDDRKQTV